MSLLFKLYEILTGRPVPELPEEWKRPSGMRKFGFWAPLAMLILAGILRLFFPQWAEPPEHKYLEPRPHWVLLLFAAGTFAGIAWFVFVINKRRRDVLFLLVAHVAFGCLVAAYIALPRWGRIALVGIAAAAAGSWGAITGIRRFLVCVRTRQHRRMALDPRRPQG